MRFSPTNFYPLIGRVPAPGRVETMIQKHFLNSAEFEGDFILPSIARDDPTFSEQAYWRGAVWAPLNFLVYLGLRNYDVPEARRELVTKSRKVFEGEWRRKGFISENYSAITGADDDPRLSSTQDYSWGVLMGLMSFIESGELPAPEEPIEVIHRK
jgi:glycogen debranching enzyme